MRKIQFLKTRAMEELPVQPQLACVDSESSFEWVE